MKRNHSETAASPDFSDRKENPTCQIPESENAKASYLTQAEIKKVLFQNFGTDPLLGSIQTAAALDLSPVHLRRLASAGKIPPPLVVGYRKLGWRLSTIKKILAEREESALEEAKKWTRTMKSGGGV